MPTFSDDDDMSWVHVAVQASRERSCYQPDPLDLIYEALRVAEEMLAQPTNANETVKLMKLVNKLRHDEARLTGTNNLRKMLNG